MNFVFLAAGKSSRIYAHISKPKCMISINSETIIENLLKKIPNKYKKFIVTGFKSSLIKNYLKSKKIKVKFLHNRYYKTREMLYSIIFSLNKLNGDVIYSYSDIIYQKKILQSLIKKKPKYITIPILKEWKNVWKIRNKKIEDDAENLIINSKKKTVIEIGSKIKKKFPEFQFMGLIYIPSKFKEKIIKFYKKNDFKKLQTTGFLQELIKNGYIVKYEIYTGKWYEFDDFRDYKNYKKRYKNFF